MVNKNGHRKFICKNCLHLFNKSSIRDRHHTYCVSNPDPIVQMPNNDYVITYFGYHRKILHAMVILVDTEFIQPKIPRYASPTQGRYGNSHSIGVIVVTVIMDHGPSNAKLCRGKKIASKIS